MPTCLRWVSVGGRGRKRVGTGMEEREGALEDSPTREKGAPAAEPSLTSCFLRESRKVPSGEPAKMGACGTVRSTRGPQIKPLIVEMASLWTSESRESLW